jgi:hypothetical protein
MGAAFFLIMAWDGLSLAWQSASLAPLLFFGIAFLLLKFLVD